MLKQKLCLSAWAKTIFTRFLRFLTSRLYRDQKEGRRAVRDKFGAIFLLKWL
jgi:hypothetical protein